MKSFFAAFLLSLSIPSLAAQFSARVDEAWCGEVSAMVIGDACILQVTKTDGKKLGLVFDFDDFLTQYGEAELAGAQVKINDGELTKIDDAEVIRELQEFSSGYFYMYAQIDALTVLPGGDMGQFVTASNGNFYAGNVPAGYRAVKLEKLAAKGGLKTFIETETKQKMKMWKDYVLTSGEYDHVTLRERQAIAVSPLKTLEVKALLETSEIFAIYKGAKLIGYFVEVLDHVQAAIYQDGAWIDLFIDAEQNVVRSFDQSA